MTWKDGTGRVWNISDMANDHLENAIGERPTDRDSVMKLALDAGNELPIWEHGLRGVK